MERDKAIELLKMALHTMNQITVTGLDNMDKFVGTGAAIQQAVALLENKEENNG